MVLPGFRSFEFSASNGRKFTIYRRGTGPGILVMHEVPGITPEVADFGIRLADAGFTVWMPNIFGEANKPFSKVSVGEEFLSVCARHEFKCFEQRVASPMAETMREIGRKLFEETGGKGIGALGMCITGNFALAMMADEFILAPVLSQPALPVPSLLTESAKQDLHISEEQLATLKQRVAAGVLVLGLRFSEDTKCPKERFQRLRDELGTGFEGIEIDSRPGNGFNIEHDAHSVLTHSFVDEEGHPTKEAFDRVVQYFEKSLM